MSKAGTAFRKRPRAFTLVELLVVVAIIALLVSILMPSLSKAKEQTRRVLCASNLRNCGTALSIYTAENRGYFPPAYHNDRSYQACIYRSRSMDWDLRDYIRPYIGDFNLWKCPALPMTTSIGDYPPGNVFTDCTSYATYRYYPGRRGPQFARRGTEQYNNPKPQPNRYVNVDNAAGRVMMQDTFIDDWVATGMMLFNHGQGVLIHDGDGGYPTAAYRNGPYGYGAGIVFYDGHAEWVNFQNLEPVGSILGGGYLTTLVHSRLP